MPEKTEVQPENVQSPETSPKKLYSPPKLEKLGDLRTITLGGSPGTGDLSGNPLIQAQLPPP